MNFLKRNGLILLFIAIVIFFFKPFIVEGKLPIPSDTIIGLYHPYRDLYAKEYPLGIPFKNPLITDPVRQQYPWKELAVDILKRGEMPLWNPYSMAGYPLAANLQSAVFYPLNIAFFILPFQLAWGFLILLESFLAGFFLYLYLRNLQLSNSASLIGALAFSFSGFSIVWLEWGTILHSALWLPLILLSIDKIIARFQSSQISNFKFQKYFIWSIIFIFSLASSLFAGHLQTVFYVFLLSFIYLLLRWWQYGRNTRLLLLFAICYLLFAIITAIQWIQTLQLIGESARSIDQLDWRREGWFVPWQHLVQFIAPDFFGNPATGNYWGVWNYGEFVGYIGVVPLLMALFAIISRRDKKTIFFMATLVTALFFSLPTIIAKLPYILNIPFLSTAQPTRLLFVTDFSLAILAALGFDYLPKERKKIWYPIGFVGLIILGLWLLLVSGNTIPTENRTVVNNNLLLPTILTLVVMAVFFFFRSLQEKKSGTLLLYILIGITVFDLIRFGWKFTPFTNQEYLFPSTAAIVFLQQQEGQFRIMATDDRILPPNFSIIHRLQSISGYDPLYLQRFGELIAASERGEPNIDPPLGFNRIVTPKNYNSKIIDLLGVKYLLSLSDLDSPKLLKVFQEGKTRVYENKDFFPRAFFVKTIHEILYSNRQEAIDMLLKSNINLHETAIVEFELPNNLVLKRQATPEQSIGKVLIKEYSENKVTIETENEGDGFLVLTDTYYPSWKAKIDGREVKILRADYNFRGVFVPKGGHAIEFYNTLF